MTPRPDRRTLLQMLTAGAMAARAAPSMAIAQAGASLGANAAERGILLGSAVTNECLSDKAYRDILFAQSRMLVPEWDMTFHFLRPQRGSFNTAPADQLVERLLDLLIQNQPETSLLLVLTKQHNGPQKIRIF